MKYCLSSARGLLSCACRRYLLISGQFASRHGGLLEMNGGGPLSEGSFPDPCSCWEHSTSSSRTCPGPTGGAGQMAPVMGLAHRAPLPTHPPPCLSHGFLPSSAHLPWPLLAWPSCFLPAGATSILATDRHGTWATLLCRVGPSLGFSAGWGDAQDLRSSRKRHFWNALEGLPASRDQTLTRV